MTKGQRRSGLVPVTRLLLAFLALPLLLPLAPAHAADTTSRQRPGRYKVGPLYLTPKLELKNAGVVSADRDVYFPASSLDYAGGRIEAESRAS